MKTILFLSVLSLFISHSSTAQGDIETIRKLNRSFLDAIVNKDTAALSGILADDFMLINPGGYKKNKTANLANLLIPNQQVVSVDIDSADVRLLSGNVGLITAWTTNIIIADGIKSTVKICYQDVYMKRKNRWLAVAAHVALLGAN